MTEVRKTVRLPEKLWSLVTKYMEMTPSVCTESEAIRTLIQKGLEKEGLLRRDD